jgi:hypothetical protein
MLVGAAVMVISTLLPFDEPTTAFGRVSQNTLIQNGGGWYVITPAAVIAYTGFRASRRNGEGWVVPIIFSVLAALIIGYLASDKGMRTLYPVGLNGTIDTSGPGVVTNLGIAIYVTGVGVALTLIGAVLIKPSSSDVGVSDEFVQRALADEATKKCPDCAETILDDAKVCKHCGYRFSTTDVKCVKCDHVQQVLISQESFRCEQCNTRLKRKTGAEAVADEPLPSPKTKRSTPPGYREVLCPQCNTPEDVPAISRSFVCPNCNKVFDAPA